MALKHSKFSSCWRGELLKLFVAGATARTSAELVSVHNKTVALFFRKLRELIADHKEHEFRQALDGEMQINESYFGGARKRKRVRAFRVKSRTLAF